MEERITICRKCYDDNFKGVENAIWLSLDIIKCSMCEERSHAMLSINETIYKNTMENKEKTLKMSLETARQIYKTAKETQGAGNPTELFLLENFTREELEESQGYTWEESFKGYGSFISINSKVISGGSATPSEQNKNVFKTEKQALSALAFAQLSHIVAHANSKCNRFEASGGERARYAIQPDVNGNLMVMGGLFNVFRGSLCFNGKQDAENSLIKNKELWEQYFAGFGVI